MNCEYDDNDGIYDLVTWPFEGTKDVYFAAHLDDGVPNVKSREEFYENYIEDFDNRHKYQEVKGMEPINTTEWLEISENSQGEFRYQHVCYRHFNTKKKPFYDWDYDKNDGGFFYQTNRVLQIKDVFGSSQEYPCLPRYNFVDYYHDNFKEEDEPDATRNALLRDG